MPKGIYKRTEQARLNISLSRRGKKNWAWKGGRTIDSKGYVLIWKPEHPYGNKNGYVFEHRLVMEEYLKRILDRKEMVHHKNHVPDDNRLENLMVVNNKKMHFNIHPRNRGLNGKFTQI